MINMADNTPNKYRTYTFSLERNLPTSNPDCKSFQEYIRAQISGSRQLIKFDSSRDTIVCSVNVRFQAWSFGKMSSNRLRKNVERKFPDCRIKQFRRHRKNQNDNPEN